MRNQNHKIIFLTVFVLAIVSFMASQVMAGDYLRRGRIHLPKTWYAGGDLSWWYQGASNGNVELETTNRSNKNIKIRMRFRDSNANLIGVTDWVTVLPHDSHIIFPHTISMLQTYNNQLVNTVIEWKGKVEITPMCDLIVWVYDANNKVIHSLTGQYYDDTIR